MITSCWRGGVLCSCLLCTTGLRGDRFEWRRCPKFLVGLQRRREPNRSSLSATAWCNKQRRWRRKVGCRTAGRIPPPHQFIFIVTGRYCGAMHCGSRRWWGECILQVLVCDGDFVPSGASRATPSPLSQGCRWRRRGGRQATCRREGKLVSRSAGRAVVISTVHSCPTEVTLSSVRMVFRIARHPIISMTCSIVNDPLPECCDGCSRR